MVLADVTIVGYAITAQIAGVLFVGILCPLMIQFILRGADRRMLPIIYSAVRLEVRYGGDVEDWLATTFLSNAISFEHVAKIKYICSIPDQNERMKQLRQIKGSIFGEKKVWLFLIIITMGHIIAPVILFLTFQWRFF